MTTQRINVDLVPGTSSPSVQVSQGDHELRTIVVTLLNEGKKNVTIPAGASVEVRGTKPSGKGFSYACSFSGDEVTIKVKDQMTAEKGRVPCEIVVELNGHAIGSSNFDMLVESAALQPGTVASSDTFDSLVRKVVVNAEGNLFANALKGTASGSSIQVDDVSPIEHSPEVWAHGKNLCSVNTFDNSNASVRIVNPNGIRIKKGKTYTFSCSAVYIKEGMTDRRIQFIVSKDKTQNANAYDPANQVGTLAVGSINSTGEYSQTVTATVSGYLYLRIVATNIFTLENIQLEEGETATDYEPWLDPTTIKVTDGNGNTFTPNTDGTVEGVTSTSPTMTLSTDNESAIIDVEYNRDLTAAIAKIEAALFN